MEGRQGSGGSVGKEEINRIYEEDIRGLSNGEGQDDRSGET